jgi:hypothetical protein
VGQVRYKNQERLYHIILLCEQPYEINKILFYKRTKVENMREAESSLLKTKLSNLKDSLSDFMYSHHNTHPTARKRARI